MNALIELAKSGHLDMWTLLRSLHNAPTTGVIDFISNELYKYDDNEIELFIPQLCNKTLKDTNTQSLARCLMDRCQSLHLALKMYFWYQAAVEDGIFTRQKCHDLWNECEMAAVNSKSRSYLKLNSYPSNHPLSGTPTQSQSISNFPSEISRSSSNDSIEENSKSHSAHRSRSMSDITETIVPDSPTPEHTNNNDNHINIHASHSDDDIASERRSSSPTPLAVKDITGTYQDPLTDSSYKSTPEPSPSDSFLEEMKLNKRQRHTFFHRELEFIQSLTQISTLLKKQGFKSKAELNALLWKWLEQVQEQFFSENSPDNTIELYLPTSNISYAHRRLVRIIPQECFCLNSRDRVPFMLFVETISEVADEEPNTPQSAVDIPETTPVIPTRAEDGTISQVQVDSTTVHVNANATGIIPAIEKMMEYSSQEIAAKKQEDDWVLMDGKKDGQGPPLLSLAFPETWQEKQEKLKKLSPYKNHPNWRLQSVIVKSGDDLRQEQLAMQLISTMYSIFKKADLSLWLYPYSVIAINSNSGLIETVPDAISLDTLKKRIPNMKSLEDYFVSVYGIKTSIRFLQAQRNFVESLAGYSLVCYLLQIKDRHNGNILIDKEGHIIHIDYGFMLTSSPGSLNFETAPFKMTKEFIDVMGGEQRDMFNYFKLLFIRGFLELRRHFDKIILLVEMLLPGHKMGCFARREATIRELKERFQLDLSEQDCVVFVGNLIKDSLTNWRTESYDNYQYYVNGILV